ncbi:homeobox-leucine zipper protein ROC2-like isoform X2 [Apium graveolens]
MEQNSATGHQEAGLVGFGGIQNGDGYDNQGFTVVAAGAGALAAGAGAGAFASGAGVIAMGGAGGAAVGGGVSVADYSGGAAAVAGPSFQSARGKKRAYHRHSQEKIDAMEACFKDHPHLAEPQRNDLARNIGMASEQVKFWFQNKRTQVKNQCEREEVETLRSAIEVLTAQKQQNLEALRKNSWLCTQLSEEKNRLRSKNIRIIEATEVLNRILARYIAGEDLQNLAKTFQDLPKP